MVFFSVLLVLLSLIAHGCTGEVDCRFCKIEHPQQMVCGAQFAFVGKVLLAEEQRDYYRYEVQISEGQVFKGLSLVGVETETVGIYTPYGTSLCGRPDLEVNKKYLLTGSDLEGELTITYCDWVAAWGDVPPEQKKYLKTGEYLDHCKTCPITGVKGALTAKQEDLGYRHQVAGLWTPYNCYYNPVASVVYDSEDCETAYSYCHRSDEGERCDWMLTPDYEECFRDREGEWSNKEGPRPAAALTDRPTVKECRRLETKKMKKQCLKKVKKYLKAQRANMEPREMLEEMINLRDLWLDDQLFED